MSNSFEHLTSDRLDLITQKSILPVKSKNSNYQFTTICYHIGSKDRVGSTTDLLPINTKLVADLDLECYYVTNIAVIGSLA